MKSLLRKCLNTHALSWPEDFIKATSYLFIVVAVFRIKLDQIRVGALDWNDELIVHLPRSPMSCRRLVDQDYWLSSYAQLPINLFVEKHISDININEQGLK